jgi:5-methylcytosine-specific restriction endonuclease McrBC GTP-binding regulatory subunit McrB
MKGEKIEQLKEEQQPQKHKLPQQRQRQEIYPVTEGLASPYTASKYRLDFAHFLDYIRIHDLEVLLDLGSD